VAGNPLSVLRCKADPADLDRRPYRRGCQTSGAHRRLVVHEPQHHLRDHPAQLALFDAERAAAGLPPASDRPIAKEVICAATTELAWETGGPLVAKKYQAYANWGQDASCPTRLVSRRPQDAQPRRFVIGSAQECRRSWPCGGRHRSDPPGAPGPLAGMPAEVAIETLERLTGEVVPYLGGGD